MAQNSVKPLLISSILSSNITALYQPLNGTGFAQSPFFFSIINASSMGIIISYDGVNDHEFVESDTTFEFPSQGNSQPNAQVALFPKNTVVYVKGTAGTGNVYLSGYYV
jgi:hypothetical protein